MKVTIEFNLPEEEAEFLVAQRGSKYLSMINEFENYLRKIYKYEEHSEEVYKKIDEIRDEFYSVFQGYHDDIG
jgi:hypothetical protein